MSLSSSSRSAAVPPSPTSPPESGLKRRRLSNHLPESPKSPSLMSVATKSYVSPYGTAQHQHSDEASGRSSPRSPRRGPESASRPVHPHSLPTPAHSVTGISSFDMADDTDQHRDKRARLDPAGNEEVDRMEVEPLTQATNHDRHNAMDGDRAMDRDDAESPGTMKDPSKVDAIEESSSEKDEMTLEQLQKDMGEAFLLCRSKVERQRPDPQQHLLALYGLGPILRSVARTDPKTGEKINKLRKSYEGQIKGFGLAGRNKPVKGERNVEEDEPGPLRRMAGSSALGLEPDEQWNSEHARLKIEVTSDFKAKLRQAMQMQPGTVKNNAHWEDVLGFDKPRPQPYAMTPQQPTAVQPPISRISNGATVRPPAPAVSGPQSGPGTGTGTGTGIEPKRLTRGKKRSYGDDSFVGYGEGFSDGDDGDDGDDYGSQRKRKKDPIGTGLPLAYGQDGGGGR